MKTFKLHLIRHGMTAGNLQGLYIGSGTDIPLCDELRDILEKGGKLYTQLKIDDISNLGAVKIRIRSLMAAMEARQAQDARG